VSVISSLLDIGTISLGSKRHQSTAKIHQKPIRNPMPSHPFRIREIAVQAGLSEATVDRVLNGRGGVRDSTAREVRSAIADLERQRDQVRLAGRTFLVDVVMQAPARFSAAVRAALEAELPLLRPAVIRARFHFRETGPPGALIETLDRIGRQGTPGRTRGVMLKGPDTDEMNAAVARLTGRGIPVVTLVTDLPRSPRTAYIGIDNRAAGATAAYLITQWLGRRPGAVLVTLSRSFFRGEEEREMGFRAALRSMRPDRRVIDVTDTDGLDATIRGLVRKALKTEARVPAVYSIGGGNTAILDAFAEAGRPAPLLVAHDLDEDNLRLLRGGRIAAVLHHDLRLDMRRASQVIMSARRGLPEVGVSASPVQVVTPFNIP
jgi:LacI family transcriptional regulator